MHTGGALRRSRMLMVQAACGSQIGTLRSLPCSLRPSVAGVAAAVSQHSTSTWPASLSHHRALLRHAASLAAPATTTTASPAAPPADHEAATAAATPAAAAADSQPAAASSSTSSRLSSPIVAKYSDGPDSIIHSFVIWDKLSNKRRDKEAPEPNSILPASDAAARIEALVRQAQTYNIPLDEEQIFHLFLMCGPVMNKTALLDRLTVPLPEKLHYALHHFILMVYVELGWTRAIGDFLHRRANSGFQPSNITYEYLIATYAKQRALDRCTQLFAEMTKRGIQPRLQTYTEMIYAFARWGMMQECRELYEQMKAHGFQPDTNAHNAIVLGLSRSHRLPQALKWVEKMHAHGPPPNVDTLIILLERFLAHPDAKEAVRVWKFMLSLGIQANELAWAMLINIYGRAGMLAEAENVVRLMDLNGTPPSEMTFTSLLEALAAVGDVNHAQLWLERMQDRGFQVPLTVYNSMLHGIAQYGRVAEAWQWFERMVAAGHRPNLVSFTNMIKCFCRAGQPDQAGVVFEVMDRWQIKRDAIMYAPLVNAFCAKGQFAEAANILKTMHERSLKADALMYERMIGCLGQMAAQGADPSTGSDPSKKGRFDQSSRQDWSAQDLSGVSDEKVRQLAEDLLHTMVTQDGIRALSDQAYRRFEKVLGTKTMASLAVKHSINVQKGKTEDRLLWPMKEQEKIRGPAVAATGAAAASRSGRSSRNGGLTGGLRKGKGEN